jgi:hypothetical protein
MAARLNKKPETSAEKSQLPTEDIRLLLVVCTELVNLCAKLTGKIDPAASSEWLISDPLNPSNSHPLHDPAWTRCDGP